MSEIEDKIAELKIQRQTAYDRLKASSKSLFRARRLVDSLQARYNSDKKEWEDLDRQLAMLDGRFKVEEPAWKRKAPKPASEQQTVDDMSLEQLEALAAKLGIKLNDKTPEVGTPEAQEDSKDVENLEVFQDDEHLEEDEEDAKADEFPDEGGDPIG